MVVLGGGGGSFEPGTPVGFRAARDPHRVCVSEENIAVPLSSDVVNQMRQLFHCLDVAWAIF